MFLQIYVACIRAISLDGSCVMICFDYISAMHRSIMQTLDSAFFCFRGPQRRLQCIPDIDTVDASLPMPVTLLSTFVLTYIIATPRSSPQHHINSSVTT